MTDRRFDNNRPALRLWPGIVLLVLQWLIRFGVPAVMPEQFGPAMLGGLAIGLLIILWWAFFSRIPHLERWSGLLLVAAAMFLTPYVLDPSIATGMMGMMFYLSVVPLLCLGLVVWAVWGHPIVAALPRRLALVACIALACGFWSVVRTDGIAGSGLSDLAWRWSPTAEDLMLATDASQPANAQPIIDKGPAWRSFRGTQRDGIVRGVQVNTGWDTAPPEELWRQAVGPGWSSFAVLGNVFYTQEQRGEEEAVTCYAASSGDVVWRHTDPVRFWESNAGAGPRGTPTLHGGRLYSLGATGVVNALDALTGERFWSRDGAADTETEVPMWGYSSSPLVVGDLVIVALSGDLVAYDAASGEPRWFGPETSDGESYSSPHLFTLDGVSQIVLIHGAGVSGVDPADGSLLWSHDWPGYPIVQPAVTADGDLLISVTDKSGVRRLSATQGSDGWQVEEVWTTLGLKPYFNDFVVHKGHAYGFDGRILASISLEDGERQWKGGRYGNGQLILLAEQDLLLILSEKGEVALVSATPDQFTEVARVPAIEGKTWNHPVLVNDLLLVRNGEEMVGFRVSTQPRVASGAN